MLRKFMLFGVIMLFAVSAHASDKARGLYKDDQDWVNEASVGHLIMGVNADNTVTSGDVGTVGITGKGGLLASGAIAESTIPTEGSDGVVGDVWHDTFYRAVNPSFNKSTNSDRVTPISSPRKSSYVHLEDDREDIQANTVLYSSGFDAATWEKVGVFVEYDETDAGANVQGVFSLQASHDDTTYFDIKYYDIAGAATLQASETFTVDTDYYAWLDGDMGYKYLRVKLDPTAAAAANEISSWEVRFTGVEK